MPRNNPLSYFRLASIVALASLLLLASPSWAQDDEAPEGSIYVPLTEPLVVNYGGPGRLKYLRAELALRVKNAQHAALVRHHMPLIRANLVMLFSRQKDEDVNSQTGREQLRQLALAETNALLRTEEGEEQVVENLLFNNFVVQK